METIKSIDIVFENCEAINLLPNMFKCLHLDGIKKNLWINSFQYENGETEKDKICEEFGIIINKKGLNETTSWNDTLTLKERLKQFKDIVAIDINYNHKNEYIYVPWNEENDYSNKYQTIEEIKEGIRVRISKEMEEKDYE